MSKLSEDQKKGLHRKWNTFSPEFKWTPTLRCTPESNYWGDANENHTQTIGGDTVKILGWIYPPIPPGFGTPVDPASILKLGNASLCFREKPFKHFMHMAYWGFAVYPLIVAHPDETLTVTKRTYKRLLCVGVVKL